MNAVYKTKKIFISIIYWNYHTYFGIHIIFILSFPIFIDFYGVLGVNTFHARQLSFH